MLRRASEKQWRFKRLKKLGGGSGMAVRLVGRVEGLEGEAIGSGNALTNAFLSVG